MQQKFPEKQLVRKPKVSSISQDSNLTTRETRVDVGLIENNPGFFVIAAGCSSGFRKMPGRAARACEIAG